MCLSHSTGNSHLAHHGACKAWMHMHAPRPLGCPRLECGVACLFTRGKESTLGMNCVSEVNRLLHLTALPNITSSSLSSDTDAPHNPSPAVTAVKLASQHNTTLLFSREDQPPAVPAVNYPHQLTKQHTVTPFSVKLSVVPRTSPAYILILRTTNAWDLIAQLNSGTPDVIQKLAPEPSRSFRSGCRLKSQLFINLTSSKLFTFTFTFTSSCSGGA